jgi:2-oxoisovalerate dehydrogenase E1 component beta subunit
VLYFEHKHLYRRLKGDVPEGREPIELGRARVHRPGDDATVVTWGAMVHTAAQAADRLSEQEGIEAEVLDLRTILPWDREAVLDSVRRTSRLLVLHEDTRTAGFGAEIAATVADEAFSDLDAPVRRLTAPDTPVPFSPPLERRFLPQVDDVESAIRELVQW